MEIRNRPVYTQLVKAASLSRKVNSVRYVLALSMLDGDGDGWVEYEEVIPLLSQAFGVKTKTVRNNLYQCADRGFGSFCHESGRFYYRSQEQIAALLHHPVTNGRSVVFEFDDVASDIVGVRALFEDAVISSLQPKEERATITRRTRKKISGRDRRTQRKYEKIRKVQKQSNYAVVGEYDQYTLQRARHEGKAAFVLTDDLNVLGDGYGKTYVVHQIANSYDGSFEIVRRTVRHKSKLENYRPLAPASQTVRLYFDDPSACASRYNRYPHQDAYWAISHKSPNGNCLWGVLPAQPYAGSRG